jgi:hypothetical protein
MKRRTFKAKAPRERFSISWNASTFVTVGVLIFGVLLIGPKIGEYLQCKHRLLS